MFRQAIVSDINIQDRLSPVLLNDLLDNFRTEAGIPLLSLKVKLKTSARLSEEKFSEVIASDPEYTPDDVELDDIKTSSLLPNDDEYEFIEREGESLSKPNTSSDAKPDEPLSDSDSFTINYFVYEADYPAEQCAELKRETEKKKFVVFFTTRDQDHARKGEFPYLLLASDVIKTYQENFPTDKATLLLPIVQCGVYMKLDYLKLDKIPVDAVKIGSHKFFDKEWLFRNHFVTAAVDCATKQLTIYDSQKYVKSMAYLEWIKTQGYETIYKNLGSQVGSNLCGYFAFLYIYSYLKMGDSSALSYIKIDPTLIINRDDFMERWKDIIPQLLANQSIDATKNESIAVSCRLI